MKSSEERFYGYLPLWGQWGYTGRYLGKGNMSSGVYEIEREYYGKRELAAVKMITVTNSFGDDGCAQAAREISVMNELSACPNIVKYFDSVQKPITDDSGEITGYDILIRMERLNPLPERLTLDIGQTLRLAEDICRALIYAHSKGIIHRDVKPANILASDDGIFKLGDFGIAKVLADSSGSFTTDIGTAAYAAPEMINRREHAEYNGSVDTYSLGLIMYKLLNNGYLPLMRAGASDNKAAIEDRLAGAAFPPPANGTPQINAVIMKACAYSPSMRYKSAEEMLSDINNLLTTPLNGDYATRDARAPHGSVQYGAPLSQPPVGNASEKKSNAKLKKIIFFLVGIIALLTVSIGAILLISGLSDKDKDGETEPGTERAEPSSAHSGYEDEDEPTSAAPETAPAATTTYAPNASVAASPVIVSAQTVNGAELGSSNISGTRTFDASQAVDSDAQTCWCVNTAARGGAGASIRFNFAERSLVSGIVITNGNQYSPEDLLYDSNGQVRRFRLVFSDGTSQELIASKNTAGALNYESLRLTHPVETDFVTLAVIDSYVGSKFTTNVAVGEISFY